MKIYIRNMACESCKIVVKEALTELQLQPVKVELGEAEIKKNPAPAQIVKLNSLLRKAGLEMVENKNMILIERIKAGIVEYMNSSQAGKVNFSEFITKKLNYDYNYLSNVFSEVNNTTISGYMNILKMERAKEMILFSSQSLSEISEKLNYANLAHFSAQFKKTTGFSPSQFRKLKDRKRLSVQEVIEHAKKIN